MAAQAVAPTAETKVEEPAARDFDIPSVADALQASEVEVVEPAKAETSEIDAQLEADPETVADVANGENSVVYFGTPAKAAKNVVAAAAAESEIMASFARDFAAFPAMRGAIVVAVVVMTAAAEEELVMTAAAAADEDLEMTAAVVTAAVVVMTALFVAMFAAADEHLEVAADSLVHAPTPHVVSGLAVHDVSFSVLLHPNSLHLASSSQLRHHSLLLLQPVLLTLQPLQALLILLLCYLPGAPMPWKPLLVEDLLVWASH